MIEHEINGNWYMEKEKETTYKLCTFLLCILWQAVPQGFQMITSIELDTNEVLKLTLQN